jgi:predicted DCC family thiol-disulfide oxidoreductase YuxK
MIYNFLEKAYNKKVNGHGLAIFRIIYSLVLLGEISHLLYFQHLIFDAIPFIEVAEINFAIPLGIWFISVVFILFGAFTRFFSIINYLMALILIGSIHNFEYHVFYAYMGINFLFLFLPVSQCLSIDRLLLKLKYSNTTFQYNPPITISQIYYFLPCIVGIGLVYLDSVFYKIASNMWLSGLGVWLPSTLPMITHINLSPILNLEYWIKFLGCFTILFEFFFLFIFFRKKWRWLIFTIGMGLHLGILIQFPIPWFALCVCAIYILVMPIGFWDNIFLNKKLKPSTLFVFYDAECPLCIRTKIVVNHFNNNQKIKFLTVQNASAENKYLAEISYNELLNDIHAVDIDGKVYSGVNTYIQILKRIYYLYPFAIILKLPGINFIANKTYKFIANNRNTERCTEDNCGYNIPVISNNNDIKLMNHYTVGDLKRQSLFLFIYILIIFQSLLFYRTWSFDVIKVKTNFSNSFVDKSINRCLSPFESVFKIGLGTTCHPVFTDVVHFNRYNHDIAVVYINSISRQENWLPIVNKKGMPDWYNYGCNWVNWTFRVNGRNIDQEQLIKGVERYTAFWAYKNNISLNKAKFKIKVKKIDTPNGWEKNYLNKQIAKPWLDGGYVLWQNNKMSTFIKDIESI